MDDAGLLLFYNLDDPHLVSAGVTPEPVTNDGEGVTTPAKAGTVGADAAERIAALSLLEGLRWGHH